MSVLYATDVETIVSPAAEHMLEVVKAKKNLVDPEKIAADIAAKKEAAALDVYMAGIIAGGCFPIRELLDMRVEDVADVVIRTGDRFPEAEVIEPVRRALEDNGSLVGFNSRGYDLPLIQWRLWNLTDPNHLVPAINLDRYRSEHMDLYEKLTQFGNIKAHSLDWFAQYFRWPEKSPIDGAGVKLAHAEGRWDDIALHCACDLMWTARLARFMRLVK